MGIEFEVKFQATPQVQAQIRADVLGEEAIYQMHTTYYDTPTGRLSEKCYTLRRRMENGVSVCTLKAPAGDVARGEWEVVCDDVVRAIPMLCRLGAPADLPELCKEGIVEVCGAKFTRIAKTVCLPQGVLELALDEGVLLGGGKEIPLCEVEVELKEGSREFALGAAGNLMKNYGLTQERKSKFRRALDLAKGE